MEALNKGDIVVAVESYKDHITAGKEYVLKKDYFQGHDYVWVNNNHGTNAPYKPERFIKKPIEQEKNVEKHQYEVGDKVRILKGESLPHLSFNHIMMDEVGKIRTLKRRGNAIWQLEECGCYWDESWFEPVKDKDMEEHQYKDGDKVVFKGQNGIKGPGYVDLYMNKLIGKTLTLKKNGDSQYWKFEGHNYVYDEAWFEPAEKKNVKKKDACPFKKGDRFIVLNNNRDGHRGSVDHRTIGKEFTVDRTGKYVVNGVEEYAVWFAFDGSNWTISVKNIRKPGPLRDEKGRFIKKDAPVKVAKAKKEEKKPEAIPAETLRDVIKDRVANHAGTCSYGMQYKNGSHKLHIHDACHARMLPQTYGAPAQEVTHCALNVSGHLQVFKTEEDKKFYREMVGWFINKSPYAHTFLTKSIEEAFDKGILMNIEAPTSHVVAAAVAIRTLSEHSRATRLCKRLIEDGVPHLPAWIVSQGFRGDRVGEKYVFNGYSWHNAVSSSHSIADTKRFIKENSLKDLGEVPWKNGAQYTIQRTVGEEHNPNKDVASLFQVPGGFGGKQISYAEVIKVCFKLMED